MFNDGLYEVTNFTDDVLAEDHNSVVQAIRNFNSSIISFGGNFNYGDGRDGHLKLGVISESAPTPTTSPIPNGNVTGNFYYKISIYNLSGETVAGSPSLVSSPINQDVKIDIPALSTDENITGFYIYRSDDDINYYRIGILPVDNPTEPSYFIDRVPALDNYLSQEPQLSNTTSLNCTINSKSKNIYYASNVSLFSGTITTIDTPLIIICNGVSELNDLNIRCYYNPDSRIPKNRYANTGSFLLDPPTPSTTISPNSTNGIQAQDAFIDGVLGGIPAHDIKYHWSTKEIENIYNVLSNIGKQGYGGSVFGGAGRHRIGGDFVLASKNGINILNTTEINLNADSLGNPNSGGSAGGNCVLISDLYYKINNSSILCSGSNGGNAVTTNMLGGGGGGGGLIAIFSPIISEDSEVYNISGGIAGSNNGTGSVIGASGGSNVGVGGYNSATVFTDLSRNGGDGFVLKSNFYNGQMK